MYSVFLAMFGIFLTFAFSGATFAENTLPTDVGRSIVLEALKEALAKSNAETVVDPGPPLTSDEEEGFRAQILSCWAGGYGQDDAAHARVTVTFELDRNRKLLPESILMLPYGEGSPAAIDALYQKAKHTLLACGGDEGFNLPADKYEYWRIIELTFDTDRMRIQ